MAARTFFSRSYRETANISAWRNVTPYSIKCKGYARVSHANAKAEDTETKVNVEHSALAKFAWLSQLAHGIPVQGDNVKVYTEPKEYYELVKVGNFVCI